MVSFARQTIVRIRPSIKTVRGSDIFDWSNSSELVISGCSIQPAATGLSEDGRVLGISDGLTGYLPPNADVKEGDRIRFDGETYTINGAPRRWRSATGLQDHIQVNLVRWSG